MASKNKTPEQQLSNPPSSDEDDSEQSDVDEKQPIDNNAEPESDVEADAESDDESAAAAEEEDGHYDDEDEIEEKEKSSPVKESDSGSDADSDGEPPSPDVADFTVKPIANLKSKKDTEESKKTKSNPSKKRSIEAITKKDEPKSKNPKLSDEKSDQSKEVAKKGSGSQRLWSSDDEVAVLNGMIEYQAKKGGGAVMFADTDDFYEYVKKSLQVEVTKTQLRDKVKRLKKKYMTNLEKVKNGEEQTFLNDHEGKLYELSTKIWSTDTVIKRRSKSSNVTKDSVLALPIQETPVKPNAASNSKWKKEQVGGIGSTEKYPYLYDSVESRLFCGSPNLSYVLKERIGLIADSKKREFEEKWKKLRMDEAELSLKKGELIHEQVKLVLDEMKTLSG